MTVVGADNKPAGTVADLWVDRGEPQIRYLEVALSGKGKNILLPILFADIQAQRKQVKVDALLAADLAGVPVTKSGNAVTAREEDRITAYFGGGRFYSVATRKEPLL
jgi:photosynthetic reaction center H subunit